MCGIAGIVRFEGRALDAGLLERMTQSMSHRGPDGEGYVFLAPGGKAKPVMVKGAVSDSLRSVPSGYTVGFGHRRLAILDRSPLGDQPMPSEDERVWITYNGEIYNYRELRQELQDRGWVFRSSSDTEVLLNAYREWGVECLDRLNGMFAFAIWDGAQGRLFCARDRLGMKPFYYRQAEQGLAFASEIKALLLDPAFDRAPNPTMIHDFLAFGLQDHTEETFFRGVRQLRPGHWLLVHGARVEVGKWWDLKIPEEDLGLDQDGAVGRFRSLFEDAIRIHLRSDVEVGSCLSGGLDSSSIVCVAEHLARSEHRGTEDGRVEARFKTFSSCFEEPRYDERQYLHRVVEQTGVESLEVFPEARSLFEAMPRILWFQEEPFGGTSYLAQWEVMRAASARGIRVLLDGQGGDELLCGYPGYWGSHLGDLVRAGSLAGFAGEAWSYARRQHPVHPTVFANLARATLPARVVAGARWRLKRHHDWMEPEFARRFQDRHSFIAYGTRFPTALGNHVAAYLQTHSLPALLHHEDRNSMAFSIEARLPFLDARIVDFLMALPARLKLRNGVSKAILRESMAEVLPEVVRQRTDKMGFVTPQDRWLRETLKSDLEELFATRSFAERGYWDPGRLRKAYRDYCSGALPIGASVWRWACLELWFRRFFA